MRRVLLAGAASVALLGAVACEDVVTPTGDPVDLSYAGCAGAPDNPTWFAYQDGDGPWQRVTPSSGGSFDFTLRSGRGGIATYDANSDDPSLFVAYATTEEFQANLPTCTGSLRSVSSSVTGYTQLDAVTLWLGGSNEQVPFGSVPGPEAFTLTGVDATASDLIAIRLRGGPTSTATLDFFPTSIVVRRNVTGTSTGTVDLASPTEANTPAKANVAVTNLVTGEALLVNSYVALASTTAWLGQYESAAAVGSGSVVAPYYGVPVTRLNSGENQMILVIAQRAPSSTTLEERYMTSLFTEANDRSLTLGPALGTISVTGSARPTASYTVQPEYDKSFDVIFSQGSGTTARKVEIVASSSYFNDAASVTLGVPNLSGVAGFSAAWLIVPGTQAEWYFYATDAGLSILSSKLQTFQAAQRAAVFTP